MGRRLALTLVFCLAAGSALADCASDVATLKTRVTREHDPQIAAAARKQLSRAEEQIKGSESECRNAVTRTWRALKQPTDQNTAMGQGRGGQPYSYVPYNAREDVPLNTPRR